MFFPTPGVNDQTVIMAAIGGFCRRVESGPSFCRNGPLPPSLAAHLISSSIVRVWVSPSRSQSLPQWPLSPGSDFLTPAPAEMSSIPLQQQEQVQPGAGLLSELWAAKTGLVSHSNCGGETAVWGGHCDTESGWQPENGHYLGLLTWFRLDLSVLWLPRHAVMLCVM